MAAATTGTGITVTSGSLHEAMYTLVDLMRTSSSWTVYGGGDGVGPGQGPGYYWTSAASASASTSWMCMTAPGGGFQVLFSRWSANGYEWSVYIDPLGAYTGGDYNTLPTSASSVLVSAGSFFQSGVDSRIHALVETGATFKTCGFALGAHAPGAFATGRNSFAFVPMEDSPVGETYPWVFFRSGNAALFSVTDMVTTTGDIAGSAGAKQLDYRDGSLLQVYPFSQSVYTSTWVKAIPGGVSGAGSTDIVFPIMWGMPLTTKPTQAGLKGTSSFMRWNGNGSRANFDTLNSLNYISMGSCVFPWDGSSTPGAG
jgi:hypothetical protein